MNQHQHHHRSPAAPPSATLPTDPTGLPPASPTRTLELVDGDELALRIAPVSKVIAGANVRMLAFDGSIPGPTLRVQQGTAVTVEVSNDGDLETTVHWHGLRLDNRFDGTTATQQPIPLGGRFRYRLTFPDPGVYWYHPHVREDYGQELGLYGAIVVVPSAPGYWPAAHRELTLTLDDLLVEEGAVAPFSRSGPSFAAMGRYGNVLLVNGQPQPSFAARPGEVVRLYLINTANTRVFDVALPGARMKLVGGDSGRVEREAFVDSVTIAPSERAVIDVMFAEAGALTLRHRTPRGTYDLATFRVSGGEARPSLRGVFERLRVDPELVAERERLRPYLGAEPDRALELVAHMDLGAPSRDAVTYVCPMHPDVRSAQPARCPECGMKLVAEELAGAGHGHASGRDATGIEWEDDMLELNRMTTSANTRWQLVDRSRGAARGDVRWRFGVGERIKLRLINTVDSDHPMQHPFHVHGAGRFLVLARNGVVEPNLAWKDTVLVRTGETVDLLLELTNPGRWMAHCHIAEHHESGMMLEFDVEA